MEFKKIVEDSILIRQTILKDELLQDTLSQIVAAIVKTYKNKGKVLFCGNGGSAADAQHLAAELSGRFYMDREPLFAEALHVNTSYLTAVANDYSFDEVYARLVKAFGRKGDTLVGISTSGNSKNIINALHKAKIMEMTTIGLTGQNGGKMKDICDFTLKAPTIDTPLVQEAHILFGHAICGLTEEEIFSR